MLWRMDPAAHPDRLKLGGCLVTDPGQYAYRLVREHLASLFEAVRGQAYCA